MPNNSIRRHRPHDLTPPAKRMISVWETPTGYLFVILSIIFMIFIMISTVYMMVFTQKLYMTLDKSNPRIEKGVEGKALRNVQPE